MIIESAWLTLDMCAPDRVDHKHEYQCSFITMMTRMPGENCGQIHFLFTMKECRSTLRTAATHIQCIPVVGILLDVWQLADILLNRIF